MDTDSALISALADDLDASFEALVLAHQDRLYTIALRMLGVQPPDQEHDGCPSHHGRPVQLISGRDY